MSDLPRHGVTRTARLARLPVGFAGRTALGTGKRLGGRPAELVNQEIQQRTADGAGRLPCPCGLGLALLADVSRHLAHLLLGRAADDDAGRQGHLELDPVGGLDRDGMGVAQRQLEVATAQLGAVADALDLQALLEAVGDALDHVGHQRASEAVQRSVLTTVGGPGDQHLLADLFDADVAVDALRQLALGAVDGHALGLDGDGHARGHRDGLSADSGHRVLAPAHPYQTRATTSPPTPCWRASWPVMTPLEVEMIAVPIPPWMRGMWAWST